MEDKQHISVIDPIGPAIERVKDLLFRPFDLKKWFVIGFCAFLATLGEQGLNGPSGGGGGPNGGGRGASPAEMLKEAKEYLQANLHWILPLAIFIIIVALIVYTILLWLNSRGKFMFLYCVAENRAEVKAPWRKYQQQGNSLFLFRLVVGIISLVCFGLLIVPIVLSAIAIYEGGPSMAAGILAIVFFGLIALAVIIVFALIGKFTKDFVVPVMYLRGCRAVEGWRFFGPLLKKYAGTFTCYILFYIVISLSIAMVLMTAICIACIFTCCIAGCLVALPYIGTVILLPVYVFTRSYSLYYLSQFGPNWDAFNVPTVVPLSAV